MNKEIYCCFCHREIEGEGNSAAPLKESQCCDICYANMVIPTRLMIEELLAKKDKDNVVEVSYKKNSPKFDYFKKEGLLTNYKNFLIKKVKPENVKKACKMTTAFTYIISDYDSTYQRYHKLTGD